MLNVRLYRSYRSHSNLTGSNLEGADLTEANRTGAILHGAVMYNVIFSGTMLTDADLSGAAFSSLERNAPHFAGARLPKALDALGEEMRAMLIAHYAWIRSAGRQGKRADLSRLRSEEHTSELQSLMRISYAVFCLK